MAKSLALPDERLKAAYSKLKKIRTRKDLSLKGTPLLKETFTGFDGQEHELKIRYYQVQGILHLVAMNRFLLGDDTGTGKTLMSIASMCFVWAKEPDTKAIILTNKTVVGQWALEFEKFCDADAINIMMCVGTPAKRQKIYQQFEAATGPTVMIMGYATARRDIKHLQAWKDFVLITDEATAFKNPKTQIYQVIRHLSNNAKRFWALTATLIKNNLIEGYGIYSLVVPGLFPSSTNKFMNEYCLTRLQPIPGSRRQIPVIIGYRKDQIAKFREKIDPYFLARSKQDVATELPVLTIKEHKVGLTREQDIKYQEALTGLLEIDNTGEEKETTKLTQLIYCQQIVDHPALIECEGDSKKMDELFTLLTEGEFADEKVIVFSRFRKMIDLLEETGKSKKYKIKSVRITGAEDEVQRKDAMREFQNPDSDARVCWITTAAAEGINLQAAKALVFYDTPWSAGDYLQILGRMIRIGSVHDRCYAIHLVAQGQQGTIDSRVMGVLRKKMKLVEQVMGKRIKGESMGDEVTVSTENDISDLFSALQADARARAR
jgi:SNF2 family DNA or RNA helicase